MTIAGICTLTLIGLIVIVAFILIPELLAFVTIISLFFGIFAVLIGVPMMWGTWWAFGFIAWEVCWFCVACLPKINKLMGEIT